MRPAQWLKLLAKFVEAQAGMGSFGCGSASRSRSTAFAQDDNTYFVMTALLFARRKDS